MVTRAVWAPGPKRLRLRSRHGRRSPPHRIFARNLAFRAFSGGSRTGQKQPHFSEMFHVKHRLIGIKIPQNPLFFRPNRPCSGQNEPCSPPSLLFFWHQSIGCRPHRPREPAKRFVRLFPDTEVAEDHVQDILDIDPAGQPPERTGGDPQLFCQKIRPADVLRLAARGPPAARPPCGACGGAPGIAPAGTAKPSAWRAVPKAVDPRLMY